MTSYGNPLDLALVVAALVLGHVLADFVFQTDRMVRRKSEPAILALHGGIVLAAHLVVFLPASLSVTAILIGLAATHTLLDAGKVRMEGRFPALAPTWFAIDQALHLVTLGLAVLGVLLLSGDRVSFLHDLAPADGWLLVSAYTVLAGVAFNWKGGTAVVRLVLARFPGIGPVPLGTEPDGDHAPHAREYRLGRAIGSLERFLVFILVLVNEWAAMGLVIAAKSLARFKDMGKDRDFSEYYLVGTLTSVTVAIVTGLLVRLVVS